MQGPAALPDTSALSARLAQQIADAGPLSVMEYMQQSNAAYYGRSDPLGRDGDFVTAPEISQMFGELCGLWFADLWLRHGRPKGVSFAELGPGRGTLAADAVRAMGKFQLELSVHFVETSAALRDKQMQSVTGAAYHDRIDTLPDDGPLFVVANEFFDALPVRQYIMTSDGWRERVILHDNGNRFTVSTGDQPCDHKVPEDIRNAEPGSIFEITPDTGDVITELSIRLQRQGGAMLIVDYGYGQPGLGSTLQAVKDHKFTDPFATPGEIDLTAHVNFGEIATLARQCGLRVSGPVDQGLWLSALGIDQRASALVKNSPDRAQEIVEARNRLVKPEEMGQLFKVVGLSAQNWPEPEGFTAAAV